MKEISVQIKNQYGLHARPASLLANTAGQFTSEVWVVKNGNEVNAKSIMNLLLLAAEHGSELTLRADGSDEDAALDALKNLIEVRRFDED